MILTETQQRNYDNHCIIQWFGSKSRPQTNFRNNNIGSRKITPDNVETKTTGKFNEADENLSNSHKITLNEGNEELIPQGTKDIFLYGHSTYREYSEKRDDAARGVSIGHQYISAKEMVNYLNEISDEAVKTESVRIWLMSCYTGTEDLGEYIPGNEENEVNKIYADSFTNKLSSLGWTNTKVIGFDNGVGHSSTLPACREYAAKYKIKTKLKKMGRPGKAWIICENGEIKEHYTFN